MNLENKAISTKRERTRQAIISAAMTIMARKGLAGTSIDELMGKTGMARGTFYNYFQNREELLIAVIEQARDHIHQRIEKLLPADIACQQIVANMMYAVIRYSVERPCFGWLLIKVSSDTDFFSPLDMHDPHFRRTNAALMQMVKRNIHFLTAQIYMSGGIDSLIRHLLQQHIDIEQAEQLMALILQGVGVEAGQVDEIIAQAREFAEQVHLRYLDNQAHFSLPTE